MMNYIKNITMGLILGGILTMASASADERDVFLQGPDFDQAVKILSERAIKECEPPVTKADNHTPVPSVPDDMCLARSVNVQATPDSVRQMTTTDLRHKMAMLGKECRLEPNGSRRQVVCEAQRILMVEHKKRVWAFGPIAENGGPQWKE